MLYPIQSAIRAAVACGLLLMATPPALADDGEDTDSEWTMGGQNLNNWRNQDQSELSAENVAKLTAKWTFTTGGDVSATPAVANGTVYFPDLTGDFYAVDAKTGSLKWKSAVSDWTGVPNDFARNDPLVFGNMVILGDQAGSIATWDGTKINGAGARMIAVNARTGKLIWMSQVDTFPAAMHIAAVQAVQESLVPSVEALAQAISDKAAQWADVVKIGRTHLEDAVPLTVGQEWSGYAHQLSQAIDRVKASAAGLYELAAGGTAVGTGLNAPPGFGEQIAAQIAAQTGYPFVTAANKFAAQGGLDAMVGAAAGLRGLAVPLMKIANDIRWLASGPRCGLSELILPANEPGSSIMPGKVNPTQCEAMVMVCIQVLADDSAVAFAGSQGNFELNAMRPVIISNFLHSATILADACGKLRQYCIEGTSLHRDQVDDYVGRSLMLVTALSPVIGYDKASAIAHKANDDGTTLRQAALATGYISADDFDRIVNPSKMVGDPAAATASA